MFSTPSNRSVFHLISNKPLINLLYTALFHPLSPDASGETVISAESCVITVDEAGKKDIRIDKPISKQDNEGKIYPFGGQETMSSQLDHDAESCVFIFAPALSEVLSSLDNKDSAPLSKTRPNPYRKALLQCLEVPHHMSDFRKLAVNTVDAALLLFDGKFVSNTLLGKGGPEHSKLMEEVVYPLAASLVNGKPGPFGKFRAMYQHNRDEYVLI